MTKQIGHHRAIQSELGADFGCIGKLRSRSFVACGFILQIAIFRHEITKHFHAPKTFDFRPRSKMCVCHYVSNAFLGPEKC